MLAPNKQPKVLSARSGIEHDLNNEEVVSERRRYNHDRRQRGVHTEPGPAPPSLSRPLGATAPVIASLANMLTFWVPSRQRPTP
jgi:hypothetical protein